MAGSLFLSQSEKTPTEIKAPGGWQRCADEDVALMCDAHLAGNNAEALLNNNPPAILNFRQVIMNCYNRVILCKIIEKMGIPLVKFQKK